MFLLRGNRITFCDNKQLSSDAGIVHIVPLLVMEIYRFICVASCACETNLIMCHSSTFTIPSHPHIHPRSIHIRHVILTSSRLGKRVCQVYTWQESFPSCTRPRRRPKWLLSQFNYGRPWPHVRAFPRSSSNQLHCRIPRDVLRTKVKRRLLFRRHSMFWYSGYFCSSLGFRRGWISRGRVDLDFQTVPSSNDV